MAGISGRKFAQIASTAELCFFDKVFWGEILPSSQRRGGRDIKKISRSLL